MGDKVVNLLASIVVLAIITSVLLPNRQTSNVIKSFFSGFGSTIKTAGQL